MKAVAVIAVTLVAAVMATSVPLTPPDSQVNADTKKYIQQIVDTLSANMADEHAKGHPWLRQAHAKQHGCLQAKVTVNSGLSDKAAQGLFAKAGTTYDALIRFSNGVGRSFTATLTPDEADALPDNRGMGIKLFGIGTGTDAMRSQAFTLTTAAFAFLPTPKDASEFFAAIRQGNLATVAYLALHPKIAFLYAKTAFSGGISDLLLTRWTAPVPTRHGPYAVKHAVYPCDSTAKNGILPGLAKNALRETLQKSVAKNANCLKWAVQFWSDPRTTPLDDNTVEWTTAFEEIATINIPSQPNSFTNPKEEMCRYLSFSPTLSLPAHQGAGLTQEIRSAVYKKMANLRHTYHKLPDRDPSFDEWVLLDKQSPTKPSQFAPKAPPAPMRMSPLAKAKKELRRRRTTA